MKNKYKLILFVVEIVATFGILFTAAIFAEYKFLSIISGVIVVIANIWRNRD